MKGSIVKDTKWLIEIAAKIVRPITYIPLVRRKGAFALMEKKLIERLKKIIENPRIIIQYVASKGLLNWMPDKQFLKLHYYSWSGKKFNLENPQTFNEKLQWLKLYDRKPKYTQMVDKYEVRKYVAETIGEEYLVPLLGIYNSANEIDFDMLPNQFVLKCTHDSGSFIKCVDKTELNIEKTKEKLSRCLRRNYYYTAREWPYKNVKPRIICEILLDSNIFHYKICCFNGHPKFLYIGQGLVSDHSLMVDYMDLNWNKMPFRRTDFNNFDRVIRRPDHFEEMLTLAEKLCKGFMFARIDLYEVDNKVFFSEITLTPMGGYNPFEPESYDELIGSWLVLPKKLDKTI